MCGRMSGSGTARLALDVFADVSLPVVPNREMACAGGVLALLVRGQP